MGKKKLQRFAENKKFKHVLEPRILYPPVDHEMKGQWNKNFFVKNQPIVLELGCGRGEYTVNLANYQANKNYIGIDIKGARIWRGAKTVEEKNMSNVGFLRTEVELIENFFAPGEVSEIWITFPDPQPQRSREKKRLTSPRFLNIYRNICSRQGVIHLKTDNKPFYNYSLEVVKSQGLEREFFTDDLYGSISHDEILSIQTTYERKFRDQGFNICYLRFKIK